MFEACFRASMSLLLSCRNTGRTDETLTETNASPRHSAFIKHLFHSLKGCNTAFQSHKTQLHSTLPFSPAKRRAREPPSPGRRARRLSRAQDCKLPGKCRTCTIHVLPAIKKAGVPILLKQDTTLPMALSQVTPFRGVCSSSSFSYRQHYFYTEGDRSKRQRVHAHPRFRSDAFFFCANLFARKAKQPMDLVQGARPSALGL